MFTHKNNVFLGDAAFSIKLSMIDKRFHLNGGRVWYIEVTEVYKAMRIWLKPQIDKECDSGDKNNIDKTTYSFKDAFDYLFGRQVDVLPLIWDKDLETRMAKWDGPWSKLMRHYVAADPAGILLVFHGECAATELWIDIKTDEGFHWDIVEFAKHVVIGQGAKMEGRETVRNVRFDFKSDNME